MFENEVPLLSLAMSKPASKSLIWGQKREQCLPAEVNFDVDFPTRTHTDPFMRQTVFTGAENLSRGNDLMSEKRAAVLYV